MTAMIETCAQCGKEWGVTQEPRDNLLCAECASTPQLPVGEVRVSPDGVTAVCLGGHSYVRWKVVGADTAGVAMYGWRTDRQVVGWRRTGNVGDLDVEEHRA